MEIPAILCPFLSSLRVLLNEAGLDGFLKHWPHDNSVYIDTWSHNFIRIQLTWLNEFFNLGNRQIRGCGHCRIEIASCFPVDKIAMTVCFPGLDKRDVRTQSELHQVGLSGEFPNFLAFSDNGADAGRHIECRNPSTAGANPLGERALRNQSKVQLAGDYKLFEHTVFAYIASDMRGNHSSLKHQAHSESIDAHVIADGVKPLEAFAD